MTPLRIGITGADGFLAWHLRAYVHGRKDLRVSLADRSTFASPDKLRDFVADVDAIAHLAGTNRGTEAEIRDGNLLPAQQLIDACEHLGRNPHMVFANSIQHERNTTYALAKRDAAERLARWSSRRGAPLTNLILPHIFGECGRPFYNSAVSTFCHQIARGEEPRVVVDAELELVHAQRVAEQVISVIETHRTGTERVSGTPVSVSATIAHIRQLADCYAGDVIPPLTTIFDLDLFNAYRSYLYPGHYPVPLNLRSDSRGTLFEAVKSMCGGQCFISTTLPGSTRGNHYHRHKVERFLVLEGEAVIRIRRLFSSDVTEYHVRGDAPAYVDMPALHTHNITNTGTRNLVTLFWSHEIFDPAHPDTYGEAV